MAKRNNLFRLEPVQPLSAEERASIEAEIARLSHEQRQTRARLGQVNTLLTPLQRERNELINKMTQQERKRLDLEIKLKEAKKLPPAGPRKKKSRPTLDLSDAMQMLSSMSNEERKKLLSILAG